MNLSCMLLQAARVYVCNMLLFCAAVYPSVLFCCVVPLCGPPTGWCPCFTSLFPFRRIYKPVQGRSTFCTDNGGEFISTEVNELLDKNGIKKELCTPYDHVQAVERQIRSVKTMARSMLLAANVKPGCWVDAVATAVFTLNRLTTSKRATHTL